MSMFHSSAGSLDDSAGIQFTYSGDDSTGSLEAEKTSARAQQLQALYELSSQRDLSLNKNAKFKPTDMIATPTLTTMSVRQKKAAFRNSREPEFKEDLNNDDLVSVLTEPETEESEPTNLPRHGSTSAHHSAVSPGLQKYAEGSFRGLSIVRNNSDEDWTTCDEMSIRRTGSGGLVMVDRDAPQKGGREGLMKGKPAAVRSKTKQRSGSSNSIEKEAFNRAKALELQSLLENTSNRDLSLNRNPIFRVEKEDEYLGEQKSDDPTALC